MKKVMSIAIVLMLALSCMFTAFAQTNDTASPDEAKKVTELKITKLPDKLTYTVADVIEPDLDGLEIPDDEDKIEEAIVDYLSQFNLELDLDLTGIELEAVYNDGTTEKVDAKDCKAKLADPFNYGEVVKSIIEYGKNLPEFSDDITEEEFEKIITELSSKFYNLIYREYTVSVSYQDAQASYKINLEKPEFPDGPDYDDRYEVVSVKAPEKVNYTKADIKYYPDKEIADDENYTGSLFHGIMPDYKGMEIVVKDIVTGETHTLKFDGTEPVFINGVYVDEPDKNNQKFDVDGMVDVNEVLGLDEDDDYNTMVDFSFVIKYNATKKPVDSSTSDTATKDVATKPITGGNGAVQTGNPMTAVSVALVMLVASGAMFICYRRKIEK
mgnify:CR=1 FL=1